MFVVIQYTSPPSMTLTRRHAMMRILLPEEKQMWEYTVITLNGLSDTGTEMELNRYGKNGWELVAAVPMGPRIRYTFKRKKG